MNLYAICTYTCCRYYWLQDLSPFMCLFHCLRAQGVAKIRVQRDMTEVNAGPEDNLEVAPVVVVVGSVVVVVDSVVVVVASVVVVVAAEVP